MLTDDGIKDGLKRLQWTTAVYNDRGLHRADGELRLREPNAVGLREAACVLDAGVLRAGAVRGDPEGPEAAADMEARAAAARPGAGHDGGVQREAGTLERADDVSAGWGHVHQRRADVERQALSRKRSSRWARIPREREAMHFLIVGDSGTGKSAAIRQILSQVWERGEAAIVYDPAMEYLPQFYSAARGDVILNPLDARCPFWSPGLFRVLL